MKKISEEKMASIIGGASFWKTTWECRKVYVKGNPIGCECRRIFYRLWIKDTEAWKANMPCALHGTRG